MSEQSDPIFARIARRYDFINRLLSFGREQAWRRRGVVHLPAGRVLDLGSGTGAAHPVLAEFDVVGLDPVQEMLELSPMSDRVVAIGESMPFADESFDGVFSAYVFRNLTSIDLTLAEIRRILRPGGKAVIVDLGRPRTPILRLIHRIGSAIALPLAGLIVRAPGDYWYLHKSLDKLQPVEELYAGGPLTVERTWRMGPFGFVYGVVLTK
ncbi:MAG TPA: class I SAM-dependent methyltransferase [Acidimicrobiia bacterium]|jgi:demethylmenaquinone methyltransferase/2-methoxy-6-polyprenyl-1,4-benzoquinol methylase